MTSPIVRLHAIEMVLAVLLADRAVASGNGPGWLKSRKEYILRALAKVEASVDGEVKDSLGILEIHTAVAAIFDESASIVRRPEARGQASTQRG